MADGGPAREMTLREVVMRLEPAHKAIPEYRELHERATRVRTRSEQDVLVQACVEEASREILGLVEDNDVDVDDDNIHVTMTLTAQGCPSSSQITEDVQLKLEQIPGTKSAHVQIVWEPPWGPNRMSETAKKQLGIT